MPTDDLTTRRLAHEAHRVQSELCAQDRLWDKGFTRRKFLAGAGMVSVAALGSQLVTSRAAYAAPGTSNGNTLVTVFLRGAADGLRILVPTSPTLGGDYLRKVRANLVPADSTMIPLTGGWAMNGNLAPLKPFWTSGELAFVPAVSAENISRSHFQAQQSLERGGSDTYTSGWLDRVLTQLGPGTTFRALGDGPALPASLSGNQPAMVINALKDFNFPGYAPIAADSEAAIAGLYRGLDGPLAEDVPATLAAIGSVATARSTAGGARNGAVYPTGSSFSTALADIATLIRANVGLQVATVDVGGWDTHTNEAVELDKSLSAAAKTLAAFLTDLGSLRSNVTVVVMTEFGRRVAMNASGGTDHGHGSVMWLLGGGVVGSAVHGRWNPLAADVLDLGDVPGLNNAYDVLGEIVQKRLGAGSLAPVFPSHQVSTMGLARAV